jgi:hypothetical protein
MKKRIKKAMSIEQALANKKVVELASNIAKEMWWDGVAERLLRSGQYKVGESVVEGLDRNRVDLRKDLADKIGKKEIVDMIKDRFQNTKVKFGDIIEKSAKLPDDRDVRNMKLLLTRIALRKVSGRDISGMDDAEVKQAIDKLADVEITAKELGNVMNYIRAGYGDRIAVQFIEAYLEDLAKSVLQDYLKDLT